MAHRLKVLGMVLMVFGFGFLVAAGVAFFKVQDGYTSLKAFSEVQGVALTYNDDGQLIDRGTTEGAEGIMSLLVDDWKYPVVQGDLDSNDPLVNTASEFMYQMATIVYHTLNGTQMVTLAEDVEYEGTVYEAGVHEFQVDGRYWTDFNRSHPLEGRARDLAWSGTTHALVAELGVGTLTHSALQMGLAITGAFAALGFMFLLLGAGFFWVSKGDLMALLLAQGIVKKEDELPLATTD
jgi:hypothetical protein